jgi:hypothetical protein
MSDSDNSEPEPASEAAGYFCSSRRAFLRAAGAAACAACAGVGSDKVSGT